MSPQWSLLGVKQTYAEPSQIDAKDPSRKLDREICCAAM
jgi:hypothetical protein